MGNGYDQWINVLFDDPTGWGLLSGIYHVAAGVVGYSVFWLIITPIPIIAALIKQQSIVIPTVLYLTLGSIVALVAPAELQKPAYLMLVLGITGLTYHIFKNRF